jgi:hypothetical protein
MPSNLYKFSNDASGDELLQLAVILYLICLSSNIVELSRFVTATAKIIGPDDFNSLMRRVCKMLEGNYTGDGKIPCSDWLMTSLYELYRSIGE